MENKKNDVVIAINKWNGLADKITSNVRIQFTEISLDLNCRAVWDTGAQRSHVLPQFIHKHNLIEFTKVPVPHKKNKKWRQYKANLHFLNKVSFYCFTLTECDLDWDDDIIIGMDIIKLGKFYIARKRDKTHFAFLLSKDTIKQIKMGIW